MTGDHGTTGPAGLTAALVYALTGERLVDVPADASPAGALEREGWPVTRIRAHAQQRREAGQPWPHPVSREQRAGVGAAQLAAALAAVMADLGLQGRTRGPAPARPLTQDERRLLADVPPHHGA